MMTQSTTGISKIEGKKLYLSNLGWLKSRFHFSFAEYYNPQNMHFGVLRVLNDDLVEAGSGFEMHPHRDMEIISYVVEGELTHQDSMGNRETISRGEIQYMSAGTGVVHSEHNRGDSLLRFLQIWILPDRTGGKPNYGDHRFPVESRRDNWLHMVSPEGGGAPVEIYQDANFYSTITEKPIGFGVKPGRQVYLVLIEGKASVNGTALIARDALESRATNLTIQPEGEAHMLAIEMAEYPG